MARTAAGSRSGMGGYELYGHLSEQLFRAIGGYFANFSSSVGSVSEEIYSRQAVYFSYISSPELSTRQYQSKRVFLMPSGNTFYISMCFIFMDEH